MVNYSEDPVLWSEQQAALLRLMPEKLRRMNTKLTVMQLALEQLELRSTIAKAALDVCKAIDAS